MAYADLLRKQLVPEEGERRKPYRDQFGNITIGIGRNLSGKGISEDEEDLMLANDMGAAEEACLNLFPSFLSLDDPRKAVLADMAFNMGQDRLGGFHGLLAAVAAKDWDAASKAMLDSSWANQVGKRAQHLAGQMLTGIPYLKDTA